MGRERGGVLVQTMKVEASKFGGVPKNVFFERIITKLFESMSYRWTCSNRRRRMAHFGNGSKVFSPKS